MHNGAPIVLIAGVSHQEVEQLEQLLARRDRQLFRVEDAGQLAQQIQGTDGSAVLVIDAGLLEMAHDAQWRVVREKNPELGAVVRCLIPAGRPRIRWDARTFIVHPDDTEGICDAVSALSEPALPPAS